MNKDWLAHLAPPHAPPPPGWWPPAPGWWGLALLLLGAVAALLYWWNRPGPRLRRVALRELAALERAKHDEPRLARHLQDLLRRYAVARYGRETVAGLAGHAWIDFLVAHGGGALADGSGARLLRAAYAGEALAARRPVDPTVRSRWLAAARAFIRART